MPPSFVICALAVAIVGSSSHAIAGQSKVGAKHAPVEIIPDENGNPVASVAGQLETSNWSGYVLPKFVTNEGYTSAQGTWIVPKVIYNGVSSASANWVGIGGFCKSAQCKKGKGDKTLIQLGTIQAALSVSDSEYFAWYELLPNASIETSLVVNPGDVITASLSCAGKCKGKQKWTLSMTDETTHDSWSQVVTYNSSKLSVEWIEEAPTDQNGIAPLADFDVTTFSESTKNGASADLSAGIGVVMNDPNGQSSNVSAPNSTSDGFSACFSPDSSLANCVDTS